MSATSQMAQMLDELMGKQRNSDPNNRKDETFEDEDVCKYYLAGFCPNEMFINTKADLGPCPRNHDLKFKEQYRSCPKFECLGYEESFLQFLTKMHNDMQRKIKRNMERLKLTQSEGVSDVNQERLDQKVDELNGKINEYIEKAEALGAEGRVEESQESTRVAERYKTEREQARRAISTLSGVPEDMKPMEVCEVCGCFLIVGDAQQRIDEHMTGKQHLGFAKIKVTIDELMRRKDDKRKEQEERYKKEREERESRKPKTDSSRVKRDDERDRHRSRDNRDKDRERDKDKERRKRSSPSRDEDRYRSSRHSSSSSRHRSSRESEDRHRHHRDREYDRERRRRSRDRKEPADKRLKTGDTCEDGEVLSDKEEANGGIKNKRQSDPRPDPPTEEQNGDAISD